MNLDELQAELQRKIEKLDEERRLNAEQNAKERAEMLEIAAAERTQQLKAIHAGEEKAKQRKIEQDEAEKERVRKEHIAQAAIEQRLNAAAELERQQREKLEWLINAISEVEFAEDQHRKALENMKILPPLEAPTGTEVSAEYPQTGAEGGSEVVDGNTPDTPLMSGHLRMILRQAQRT